MLSALVDFDRVCGQVATALQHSQWQIYTGLALVLTIAFMVFPPRDDPDQI